MKQRTEHKTDLLQTNNEIDGPNILVCTDLARQYRTKVNELESKHQQLTQIHSEFENKLQQKGVRLRPQRVI
jgi:hypothetical protein